MADKFLTPGSVKAGSTSVSMIVDLRTTDTSAPVTGIAHTDLTSASYLRQGGLRTAITLSALAAVDSAYSSGGWKELDATNLPGLYRLDVPDAAFATGADWVVVDVADGATFTSHAKVIALPTYASLATAVTDDIVEVEESITLQEALSLLIAAALGRTTNGGLTFKTPNGAATRITGATDSNKNRTSVTISPSA